MTASTAQSAPTVPGVAGPYLDQQIHVLVDKDTRAVTLGLAAIAAKSNGRRPAEGDTVRRLILDAIQYLRDTESQLYREAYNLGLVELQRRSDERAKAEAERTAE